jgi:hypothetical protein
MKILHYTAFLVCKMAYEESSRGGSASSDSEESRASNGRRGTLDVVPHSCMHCRRLVFVFEDSANANHEAGATFSTPIDFDFTYIDVARAAWEDCLLCQWILGHPSVALSLGSSWKQSFERLRRTGWGSNLDCIPGTGLDCLVFWTIKFGIWNQVDMNPSHSSALRCYSESGE